MRIRLLAGAEKRIEMKRAFKYEETPDEIMVDSPGQVNEILETAVEGLEDPEDLLSQEEIDQAGEQETEIEKEDIGESSDPVTLYLREIGSVPFLSRQGEVQLAKEKEQGEAQISEAVLLSPMAIRYALELGDKVERAELSVRDVLEHTAEDQELVEEGVQQKMFLKEIATLRRLGRLHDRLVAELNNKRLSKKRRERLQKNLSPKSCEILPSLKDLQHSKTRIEEIAGKLKRSHGRLIELEQKV